MGDQETGELGKKTEGLSTFSTKIEGREYFTFYEKTFGDTISEQDLASIEDVNVYFSELFQEDQWGMTLESKQRKITGKQEILRKFQNKYLRVKEGIFDISTMEQVDMSTVPYGDVVLVVCGGKLNQ